MTTAEGFAIRRNGTCLAGIEVDCGPLRSPYRGCCPTGLTCPAAYNIACCLPNTSCTDTLLAAPQPRCANPTWDLFDNDGYFCCEHGLQGYNRTGSDGCQRPGEVLGDEDVVLSVVRLGENTFLQTSSLSTTATATSSVYAQDAKGTPIGAIIGGAVGGVAALLLVGVAVWVVLRRRRRRKTGGSELPTYAATPSDNKDQYRVEHTAYEVDNHAFQEADGHLSYSELPSAHAIAELPGGLRATT